MAVDYAARFASHSTKPKYVAAFLLGDEGSDGYQHLPALLDACRGVDWNASMLTKRECCLVGYGAQSIGKILRCVGYDATNAFHRELFCWLRMLTESERSDIVYMATVALGHLGIPPRECRDRLCDLVQSDRRPDDHGAFTCRAVAFRALAQVDQHIAANLVNTDACQEFIDGMRQLADEYRTRYHENPRLSQELVDEAAWLIAL